MAHSVVVTIAGDEFVNTKHPSQDAVADLLEALVYTTLARTTPPAAETDNSTPIRRIGGANVVVDGQVPQNEIWYIDSTGKRFKILISES